jgi:hypothetical protein
LATFGGVIELMGAKILPQEPTGEIPIWLYWKPHQQTEQSLTVFVHLIGDINPASGSSLWAQDDHPPQNGRVATNLWETGVVYRDVYELSLDDVNAGEYEIWIGFYHPETSKRLLSNTGDDFYRIGRVTVEE